MLIPFKPLRLRHLPYPRSARQRRTIACLPNFSVFKLFPTSPFSQPLPATSPNLAIQFLYLLCIYHTFIEAHLIHTEADTATFQPQSHKLHSVFTNFTDLSTIDVFPLKIHRSASSLKIPFPNKHKKSGEPRLAAFNISTTGINRLLLPCEQSNQALC